MHISLTNQQVRVLHTLRKGGRLVAERTFPHPLNHWLYRKDPKSGGLTKYGATLAAALVPQLVALGLVSVTVTDPRYRREGFADSIDYHLTEAGLDAAIQGGELEFDEGWAGDLFPDEVARESAA